MRAQQTYWLGALFVGVLAAAASPPVLAQGQAPPIGGFNATIALPETIEAFYDGLNAGLEKAGDGIDSLTGRSRHPKMPGGSLDSLRPGMSVIVHYTVKGVQASPSVNDLVPAPERVTPNEGTITRVDRNKQRITVRFADGATERLRLATESHPSSSRVIVYPAGQQGQRSVYYFKPPTP